MTVVKETLDSILKVKVTGRLDTSTAPDLEAQLSDSLAGAEAVEFNFSELEYISSAGLRVLLSVKKKLGGKDVVITGANETVTEVFEITGLSDVLVIK